MREPCRVCGVCVQGGQCRWLFSACGRLRLAVILSHVLGLDLQRDGRSEFLCGKCAFSLEHIVQLDVAIGNLQEAHAAQLQRLQNERDGVKVHIANKYRLHNATVPGETSNFSQKHLKPECHQRPKQAKLMEDVQDTIRSSNRPDGGKRDIHEKVKGQLRRCVSLEPLSRTGSDHSRRMRLIFANETRTKMPLTRPRSRSRDYQDIVCKKSTLTSRSISLQSVALDQADHAHISASSLKKTRSLKSITPGSGETSWLVSDVLQLLRMVQAVRPVPRCSGSRIPVLRHLPHVPRNGQCSLCSKQKVERSLREMEEDFLDEYMPLKSEGFVESQDEVRRQDQKIKQLSEELQTAKSLGKTLKHTLDEMETEKKALSDELQEKESELANEKMNTMKRDKTIQGLNLHIKVKEKEIEDLSADLEDRDQALAKARESLHKAKLQKYQGAEDQQSLLVEEQAEVTRLQAELHASVLETQRLQRAMGSRDAELLLLQQNKLLLEQELEQLQLQKKKADKNINDLQNQLKKLNGALSDRENALEQQREEQQEQSRAAELQHRNSIERLTASLNHKDQQLQDYINMVKDLENRTQEGGDTMVAKLRSRLKEKEKALESSLDEKFTAMEEKENQIHLLQLSLREKERDVERLNNLLLHNEETINSFDTLVKERDVDLQQLMNSLKNLQKCKDEGEQNLQRALREKDAIIQNLQQALDNKTRDMEDLSNTVLNQSESLSHDLAEQMSQRLKVTEVMFSKAVKDRERLVSENQTAVENLLATISSKEQLLKDGAERHGQAQSDRAGELQNLREQLADSQMLLRDTLMKSTITQDGHIEVAELRAMLAEKDSIINKLLERGQEQDIHLEMKMGEAPAPRLLELKQTIEVLQEELKKKDETIELSRRNSADRLNLTEVSKQATEVLKKDLEQKTDDLSEALKRENHLKISQMELQATVSELKTRLDGLTANIESLTSALNAKEEIIARLTQKEAIQLPLAWDQSSKPASESSIFSLPQRESTTIGEDSQQEDVGSLSVLLTEQVEVNRALRAEQQLYSDLIRAVKEKDSVERLQVLQLELTAVSLLRQQLENGVKMNAELREQLEKEIHRVKQTEDLNPSELESVRGALEEAQRWNAALQARLGQMQNRGGGVGQANDSVDTFSFIGDQTSYMSICVGEGPSEELRYLTVEQLRLKVLELQAQNADLQKKLVLVEKGIVGIDPRDHFTPSKQPQEQLSSPKADVMLASPTSKVMRVEDSHPVEDQKDPDSRFLRIEVENTELKTLLADCGAESVSQLRLQVAKLHSEASDLRRLLKEQEEPRSKESAESSGESDAPVDLHQMMKKLRSEAKNHKKIIRLLRQQLQSNTTSEANATCSQKTEKTQSMQALPGRNETTCDSTTKRSQMTKHGVSVKSRLPVPLRHRKVRGDKGLKAAEECGSRIISTSSQHRDLESDQNLEARLSLTPVTQHNHQNSVQNSKSELVAQMELLSQESQRKEQLISDLQQQLQELHKVQVDLREKDRLCHEYLEALRAAESTITYLTACSLDSESGIGQTGDGLLHQRCAELQKQINEKDLVNAQLFDCLRSVESAIASLYSADTLKSVTNQTLGPLDAQSLRKRLENLISLLRCSQKTDGTTRQVEEKASILEENLSECIRAAEGAIQSLADVLSKPVPSCMENLVSSDLHQWLERLQQALLDRETLGELTVNQKTKHVHHVPEQSLESSSNRNLYKNLLMILQVHKERLYRIFELEREIEEGLKATRDLSPDTKAHIENLEKSLKDRQRACGRLEKKLAAAQSIIALQKLNKEKMPSQTKGVQVEAQDPGYETCARSEPEVEKEEGSSTDVDGVPDRSPVHAASQDRFSSDTNATSPSYPSSPGLSSPRPRNYSIDLDADPAFLRQYIQQLRSQIEEQNKVLQHLQKRLHKMSSSSEPVSVASDQSGEEEDRINAMKGHIDQLSLELEREKALNRINQSGSPTRIDSLVQSQARELCELREQLRVSQGSGVERRKQMLELRVALEELAEPCEMSSTEATQLSARLEHISRLLEKLEQGISVVDREEKTESEIILKLSTELQEKERIIQALRMQLPRMHRCSDSEQSDRISSDGSPTLLRTPTPSSGLKEAGGNRAAEGGALKTGDGSIRMLRRENGRLQEQLKSSEELNTSLRGELDLTRSVLNTRKRTEHPEASTCTSISSDMLAEHLQEIRALRQRLEETIRTNERLREQLERKLQEAEKNSAATNIFIAGSEDQLQMSNELHFLLTQNHTLREQLNQGAQDKLREIERLRETLARRTAKLEMSKKECETVKQDKSHLQEKLHRMECENAHQRQQLSDSQQLLQTLRVELQVHEHIKSSTHTPAAEAGGGGHESGALLDLSELLTEIRRLRVQLERSIQTNSGLRLRLEEQLLTCGDPRAALNISYLLPSAGDAGKAEVLHSQAEPFSAAHASSSSSMDSGSHPPSRLVPGHRLWADRQGRHVLGLMEDYNALRKHISEARKLTAGLHTQIHSRSRSVEELSEGVSTMMQILEEATRLLKLFWRVSLPSGDTANTQQGELLKAEMCRLKSRLSQQEKMLSVAVKRLRSTNQLKEGMERIIIEQLSMTQGVLKRARGNLQEVPLSSN